jgi:hypothetical protein
MSVLIHIAAATRTKRVPTLRDRKVELGTRVCSGSGSSQCRQPVQRLRSRSAQVSQFGLGFLGFSGEFIIPRHNGGIGHQHRRPGSRKRTNPFQGTLRPPPDPDPASTSQLVSSHLRGIPKIANLGGQTTRRVRLTPSSRQLAARISACNTANSYEAVNAVTAPELPALKAGASAKAEKP